MAAAATDYLLGARKTSNWFTFKRCEPVAKGAHVRITGPIALSRWTPTELHVSLKRKVSTAKH